MMFTVNGERLNLQNAAELLAICIVEKIGGILQTLVEAMKSVLLSLRPGERMEFQSGTISRDYID